MEEESKLSKVNGLKILTQWRKIMRIAKTESLKNDIEILSKNHERDVNRKDAILHMLDRCACAMAYTYADHRSCGSLNYLNILDSKVFYTSIKWISFVFECSLVIFALV